MWGDRPDAEQDKKVDREQDGEEQGRSLGGGVKAEKEKKAEWVIWKICISAGLGRSWM